MDLPKLIAIVLTKDERNHIVECVESLKSWVDSVVVFAQGHYRTDRRQDLVHGVPAAGAR